MQIEARDVSKTGARAGASSPAENSGRRGELARNERARRISGTPNASEASERRRCSCFDYINRELNQGGRGWVPPSRAILDVQPNTQPRNAGWKLSVRPEVEERGTARRVEKERMRGTVRTGGGEAFKLTSESFTLPASSLALINQATLRNVLSRRHRRFRRIRFRGREGLERADFAVFKFC